MGDEKASFEVTFSLPIKKQKIFILTKETRF